MPDRLKYLSAGEVATLIHRSPAAVRNLVMRRKIPFRKPGGRLLFIEDEIRAWVEGAPGLRLEEIGDEQRR